MVRHWTQLALIVGLVVLSGALAGCGSNVAAAPQPAAQQLGHINVDVHAFAVEADATTVGTGPVTFSVSNTDVQTHEMLVVPLPDAPPRHEKVKTVTYSSAGPLEQLIDRLPYDASILRLNEEQLGSLGEVANLEGGHHGEVTLDLAPGHYLLLCNLPVHFQSGMWTKLTVTR